MSDTQDTPIGNGESTLYEKAVPQIVDFSDSFDGINGSAYFYNSESSEIKVYNSSECETQYSPCSTFKIITTLLALENGVITDENSKMDYNGTIYSVDLWNKNLNLKEAFQTSCVWYFRQAVDELGADTLKKSLNDLEYGNCDISEWSGSGLNPLPELNGFWLESSLKISPKEQVEVLSQIFDSKANISQNSISILKNLMQIDSSNENLIYGKTGSGSGNSWFVGFFESSEQRWYFAVNLQDKSQATGKKAEEITLSIIEKYFNNYTK